ncbi:Gfo/Idh/MocA family protein [Pseudoroseicyclus sp. H15]
MAGRAPLSWGLIGGSRIAAAAIIPGLRAAGERVQAVATRDPARARTFAQTHGIAAAHESYDALLDDPAITAVYISLTNDAHAHWAEQALRSGRHVLCEKPLAMTPAEVTRLRAAEDAGGARLMEAFCHLYHPANVALREAIASGALGTLDAGHLTFCNPLDLAGDFRARPDLGGGAAYDLGGYWLSLMARLCGGMPDVLAADHLMDGAVDLGFAALARAGEMRLSVQASFAGAKRQGLVLIGERGIAEIDWPISHKDKPVRLTLGGTTETYAPMDPYAAMIDHFCGAIASGAPFLFDSAASLALSEQIERLLPAALKEARAPC